MIKLKINKIKETSKLSENIEKALEYIKKTDFNTLENGKYEISGKDIFAIVQDYHTKNQSEGKWEAHKKYIDIQYVIKGEEKIGWGLISDFTQITEYDSEKDIYFLNGEGVFESIKEGELAVIFPEHAHMPSLSVSNISQYVKKVVIKVKDQRK